MEAGIQGTRVQKAMARAGIASRRQAERMMASGFVKINGEEVRTPGVVLMPGDVLEVEGAVVEWERPTASQVWAFYKPKRCVCTLRDPHDRRTIQAYFPRSAGRLFPIGRLEYDDEGLLLLTNDGEYARKVGHPSFQIPRIYLIKIRGVLPAAMVNRIRMELGGEIPGTEGSLKPLHKVGEKSWLELAVRRKNQRSIRRMFEKAGHPVLKQKRYAIGPIELDALKPGESRKLGKSELARLLAAGIPREEERTK